MKVAFIGQKGIPANGGGVERYVEDLAVRLAFNDEVVVYTRSHYTLKNLTEYRGVKLVSLPTIKTKYSDTLIHSFLAVVHAMFNGSEVIHFQSIGPAIFAWLPKLLKPKIKVVATLQSRDYEHQKWGRFAKWCLLLGEKTMCRFADEVIVVTKAMQNYVEERYGITAHYIPNGANTFLPTKDNELKQWGLAKDNYIVAISRLVPHKGLQYLIEAYQALGAVDKKLVIVGEGAFTDDYVKNLHDLAQGNENIIFTGKQTGVVLAQLYANAYLFVQPSESEGLSLALLEAMARKVPTLVSDIEANREAVGETGLLFKNTEVADLTEKLRFMLEEPELAREKAEAGYCRVQEKFSWDKIAQEVVKVYNTAGNRVGVREEVEQVA